MAAENSTLDLRLARPVATWGDVPPKLCGHIFVNLGKGLVVCHGGFEVRPDAGGEGEGSKGDTRASAAAYLLKVGPEGGAGLSEWVRIPRRGSNPPSGRGDHAGATVNGKLAVFGGAETLARDSPLADNALYVLDAPEDPATCRWHRIQVCDEEGGEEAGERGGERRPCARRGHTLTTAGPDLLLFGGVDGSQRHLNDLWALRTDAPPPFRWRRILAAGQAPSPRAYHTTCARADGFLVIFGGRGEAGEREGGRERERESEASRHTDSSNSEPAGSRFSIAGDVIGLSCSQDSDSWVWTRPTLSSHVTAEIARYQHCAEFSGWSMVVHGGSSDGLIPPLAPRLFHTTSSEWAPPDQHLDATAGIACHGRARHAVALVGTELYVLGGLDACGFRNDLFVLPLKSQTPATEAACDPLALLSSAPPSPPPAPPIPSAAAGDGGGGGAGKGRGGIQFAPQVGVMRQGKASAGIQRLTGLEEVCPPRELPRLACSQPDLFSPEDAATATRATAERIIKFLVGGPEEGSSCVWEVAGPGSPWQGQRVLLVPAQERARFGEALLWLCRQAQQLFAMEGRVLAIGSPCHVFGDVHGNLSDLCHFAEKFWSLGPSLNAGKFLFLGDYVDRGCNGPEVVAYLLAQKVLAPHKWFMLRGNHEVRSINGAVHMAGFKGQCLNRFGGPDGLVVWEAVNQVFDRLPVAALVRDEIFCCHGGPPRPISHPDGSCGGEGEGGAQRLRRVEAMRTLPVPFDPDNPQPGQEWLRQLALEVMWSDPATPAQEHLLEHDGFLAAGTAPPGLQEEPRMLAYGHLGVSGFLEENRLTRVLRGHSAIAVGVQMSIGGLVVTIFSESKNHMQGEHARCGCVLVEETIQFLVGTTI